MHFNHNDHYHGFLLRQAPTRTKHALDVGCGTGTFARLLATQVPEVDALDRSEAMITAARENAPPNVQFTRTDLNEHELPHEHYDFVSCIASLHHMPFAPTVTRLRDTLRPGGVLAILGLHKPTPLDYARALAVVPANFAMRLVHLPRPPRGGWSDHKSAMPVHDPDMTFTQLRAAAHEHLPEAVVRRHFFFRHSIVYRRPSD
ncbi:methyltransferase family protein [Herbihabitans rhizosphaerae]|uniref:Methyltransferase family protein n=1 Tax=Herbihabitans rhizosphaerae TaxID=1872711 RepID=A0A4Q7L6X9_9PSEU|nr:class I SAM-dependent methyltransferase [Herbihabitans rhizosphaerae]RZS45117.1 methyltransferase family protein [Herbihabitans rhizosphaerae]